MEKWMRMKISFFVLWILFAANVIAVTFDLTSCDLAGVRAAVDSAVDGDIIKLPSCTATWKSTLETSKAVSIIGTGNTTIKNAAETTLIWRDIGDKPFRLSGIRFDSSDGQSPIVALAGPISKARIDHCVFNKGDAAIGTNFLSAPGSGPVYGVVDHCQFINMQRPYFAMDVRVGEDSWGTTAWTEGIEPGSDKMMYFEDNQFVWNMDMTDDNGQGALYGQYGGKAAFRHNNMTGFCTYVDAHGDGPDESTMYYEIYNNTFMEDLSLCIQGDIAWQRGGQWIIHDNTFVGVSTPIRLSVYWTTDKLEHRVKNTYIWGNSWNGNTDQSALAEVADSGQTPDGYSAANIRENQEYFMHAPTAGQVYHPYAPYTYPHPLTSIGSCIPYCSGKSCGDDGCGGSCGTCQGTCNIGQCITSATKLVSDDFEDGTLNKWPSPTNIVNYNAGSGAVSGTHVARGCYGDYYNINLRATDVAYPEIYLKYKIKYETGFDWSNANNLNNKHARLRKASSTQGDFLYSLFAGTGNRLWFGDGSVMTDMSSIVDQYGSAFTPQSDRWYAYEFYWKLNTAGLPNGLGWAKVDGQTMINITGMRFRTSDSYLYDEIVFVGNNGGTTTAGHDCVELDDIEIWNGLPSQKSCKHAADTDCLDCVSITELNNYISLWLTGTVQIKDLMDAIRIWKGGCL
jgi:hypothetical protein